jgi:tetratricopeptide (TPR) repeat protein
MRQALTLLLLLFFTGLEAQPGSVSESSVKAESNFIEAKREAMLGRTNTAIEKFRAIVDLEPNNDPARFELGRLLYAKGETSDAIDQILEAFTQRPNEIYAAFLAELYLASGRNKEGANLYTQLLKQYPQREEYYLGKASFLVRDQDIKGAISVYNELEKRIGVNVELARRKHSLFLGKGEVRKAEKELLTLIESYPKTINYRHLLAGFYQSQQEEQKARKVYRDILAIQPSDVKAQLALQEFDSGKSTDGDDAELIALLGRSDVDIDLKIGKLLPLVQQVASGKKNTELGRRALRLAAELRRVHPDDAKAAAIEGDLLFHTGQLREAAEAYRNTLELDDTVYPVWEQLLVTLYLDNQIVDLREYAEEALDVYPNRPAIYLYYALGEALRADYDEALSLLDQASLMLSGKPKQLEVLQEMVKVFEALGQKTNTPEITSNLLPGGPTGPLAFVWQQSSAGGELDALRSYDSDQNSNALFLELLGDGLRANGEKEAAATIYQRAKVAGSKSRSLSQKISSVKS